jgi:predicted Zn-dependent protease with MMP-like domain
MDYSEFDRRAHEMFDSIPPEFREGVDGLEVERSTVEHPSLPEVFTLGECRSEYYPSEFGGAGEVLSYVVLFYGSFLALSRVREDWDWEEELWETITHEVRHHLESLASDDALEEMDYAEDQNFRRHEGESFDPLFFRSAPAAVDGSYRVGEDVFLELHLTRASFEALRELEFSWNGRPWKARRPDRLGDAHFLRLDGITEDPLEFYLVIVRSRGALEWIRDLLGRAPLEVLQSEGRARLG